MPFFFKPIAISVVLPAFNEAANIEQTVRAVVDYMRTHALEYEVIVVNDGSIDNTGAIVEALALTNPCIQLVTHSKNLGYGSALRSGFDLACKEYIFLMDSDRQFDIIDLDRFLPRLETGLGLDNSEELILIGYRQKRADPVMRSLNAWAYHLFIQILFGLNVRDMDCAFKLFPRRFYLAIQPIKANGALFSAELLIKWQLAGFKKIEIPVRHFPRQFGIQTGANLRVIIKMFGECWQLKQELQADKVLNPIKASNSVRHKPHTLIERG
jgi:glycosyltransferase involved in cell wall biosynthesis